MYYHKKRLFSLLLTLWALMLFGQVSCAGEKEDSRKTTHEKERTEQGAEPTRAEGNKRKIIFVGIDAADWNIIMPLIKQGRMPNMKEIVENGAWCRLESFGGTSSPIVWTTIATGKMPEKHGIVNFIVKDRQSNESRPIDSTYRKTKAIWNILSDFGCTVGIIDWQVSFPPEKVNGYIITRLLFNEDNKSYPSEEQEYFEAQVTLERPSKIEGETKWDRKIRDQNYAIDYAEAVGLAMRRKYDLDFFGIYTHAVDDVQHNFWKFRAPERFRDPVWELKDEEVEKYRSVIGDFNIRADRMIGKFLKAGHTVVVASDHGSTFHTARKTFFQANRLLRVLGVLEFNEGEEEKGVDFSRTEAYGGGFSRWDKYMGVTVNMQGREPRGVVPPEAQQTLIEELIEKLSPIKIVETGQPIFKAIMRAEDLPDKESKVVSEVDIIAHQERILFYADPSHHIEIEGRQYPLQDFLKYDVVSGKHALHGIFAAMGEGIKPGKIADAKMADVAPTLLYMMGLPVGKDMDGQVLVAMFSKKYLQDNPVRYVESHDFIGERFDEQEKQRGTSFADEEIKEKLRALGYID